MRFWATGDTNTCLKYILQISKQLTSETVPKICPASVEALMENIQVKFVYCAEQTVLHIKSMGWNTETIHK